MPFISWCYYSVDACTPRRAYVYKWPITCEIKCINGVPKLHEITESTHKSASPNWNFSDLIAHYERKRVGIMRLFDTLMLTRRLYFTTICKPPLSVTCFLPRTQALCNVLRRRVTRTRDDTHGRIKLSTRPKQKDHASHSGHIALGYEADLFQHLFQLFAFEILTFPQLINRVLTAV
jgi:hypothetical protein